MLTGLIVASLAAHPGGGGFGFGLLFLILIPLFFLGLFILFASIGRRRWMMHRAELPARGAESTLAERFAQGDIDEQEYRARLEVLRASNGRADGKKA